MLEAEDITFSYKKGEKPVLDRVSLTVEPGERVGILGPSGYGKTTLMKILAGYLKPDSGRVLLDGKPLFEKAGFPGRRLWGRSGCCQGDSPRYCQGCSKGYCPVQMVWQHPEKAVNPRLTLGETLKEADRIDRQLEIGLGIEEDWKTRYPRELSGGELQRFCIARTLGQRTRYLIADEISTMLDMITQGQIWNFLIEETSKRNIGMLVVSHSRELLDYICTRQITL